MLVGAVEGEHHVLGLCLVAEALGGAGYATHVLGPDVPSGAWAAELERLRPHAVCLCCDDAARIPALVAAIDEVLTHAHGTGIVVTGAGAPDDLESAPGIAFTRDPQAAAAAVRDVVQDVAERAA